MTWDLLGFIYCLPCDSPRFLQMARHCGFFPGCNMNFVKRRRKGIGCCSMEFTPRWGDLHRHELPIRNGGFSWEYGSNVGKTMPQTTFFLNGLYNLEKCWWLGDGANGIVFPTLVPINSTNQCEIKLTKMTRSGQRTSNFCRRTSGRWTLTGTLNGTRWEKREEEPVFMMFGYSNAQKDLKR
jgi:hypothetical protein